MRDNGKRGGNFLCNTYFGVFRKPGFRKNPSNQMSSEKESSASTEKKKPLPKIPRLRHKRKTAFNLSSPRRRHSHSGSISSVRESISRSRGAGLREEAMPSTTALMTLLERPKGGKANGSEEEEESAPSPYSSSSSSSSDPEKEKGDVCGICRAKIAVDAKFCHHCGKPTVPEREQDLEKQVADAFLRCKIEEEEEEEFRLPTSQQEGYVFKRAFLYFSGMPNTLWYSQSIDSWFTGIKHHDKYVAFLQIWKGWVPHQGKKPWPIMESWYGIRDSRGIRECSFNSVTKSVTIDISNTIKYISSSKGRGTSVPDPPGTRPPRLCSAVIVPMLLDGFFLVREGGITLEDAPTLGREMTLMNSLRYDKDSDWVEALGAEKVLRVGQVQRFYAVQESVVDLTKDLAVMEHVVL